MTKISIDGICAVVIPFRESDPSQTYMEMKDEEYWNFPKRLCLIGGNYSGPNCKKDVGPKGTLLREIDEELQLLEQESHMASAEEARQLYDPKAIDYCVRRKPVTILDEDREMFTAVKEAIMTNIQPFADYWQKIPGAVREMCDPKQKDKKPADVLQIASYWTCPLSETTWGNLLYLRSKFGQLSNESFDRPVSLDQILQHRLGFVWGHDQVARDYFAYYARRSDCFDMPIIPHIVMDRIGMPLTTYDAYRKRYDLKKDPLQPAPPKP